MVAAANESLSSLNISRSLQIEASVAIVYESILEQLGPESVTPDGQKMEMKLEAWPGGRWYRDLGDQAGHWWGTVQVIKPPRLIEISGPMFMSYPVVSHMQYRLSDSGTGTQLDFLHRAFGELAEEHVQGVNVGWDKHLGRIADSAESRNV
jgi:hypothetical protein